MLHITVAKQPGCAHDADAVVRTASALVVPVDDPRGDLVVSVR
jgi:hypothetical protein